MTGSRPTGASITPLDTADRFSAWVEHAKRLAGGFSVRTKILGIVLALTTVLGLGITWQVRTVMNLVAVTELETRGLSVASDLAARAVDPILLNDTYTVFDMLNDSIDNHPDAVYGFILDQDGTVLAHTFGEDGFPTDLLDVGHTDDSTRVQSVTIDSSEGRIHDYQAPILDGELGFVRIGLSEKRLNGLVNGITTQMLVTTLFVAILGIAGASLVTWLLTRPILDLVETTNKVRHGDLTARAPLGADDEIGVLSSAFNEMVADLESNRETIAENERARSRLLDQLITAQEDERKRIARELHDGVGQALSSIMLGASMIERSDASPQTKSKVADLRVLTSETLMQVRRLGRELRPSVLDDLGLAAALDRYASEFALQYPEIAVDLHCDLDQRLPPTVETSLYRVVQEAMTNVARHSHARRMSVLVARRNESVRIIIEDDGNGFDPVATRKNGQSVGIHGMAERADLLGGRLDIESNEEGTTVYVEVPVETSEKTSP